MEPFFLWGPIVPTIQIQFSLLTLQEIMISMLLVSRNSVFVGICNSLRCLCKQGAVDQSLPFQHNAAFALLLGAFYLLSRYAIHCIWVTSEAYSSPSIVLAARGHNGGRVIFDDYREAYYVTENQFGFMPGRSTMEAIFLIRQFMERYREQKKDLHMVFIDLEKAYDKMSRNIMW
jgi:hypothetical protein